MATFTILETSAPYYTISVEFLDNSFNQIIISNNTGDELTTQLQSYADEYEGEWAML